MDGLKLLTAYIMTEPLASNVRSVNTASEVNHTFSYYAQYSARYRPIAKGVSDPPHPRQSKALSVNTLFGLYCGFIVIHKAVINTCCVTCNFKLSYIIVMIVFTEHRAIQNKNI